MKSTIFSIAKLLALVCFAMLFAQSAFSQEDGELQDNLRFVSLKATKQRNGLVSYAWSIRNDGSKSVPLTDLKGNSLVSYAVEGSSKREAETNADFQLVQENVPLNCGKRELKPGETASGSFTLPSQKELVSYRVSVMNALLPYIEQENLRTNSIIAILIGL
ncbi:MAG: hypothetical protein IT258_17490 [Saprospiraceae bacterium]|nr:hypothetical protein [Saprospiraceae bacterium]